MGARSPDRVRFPPTPAAALTIGEMNAQGWTLRAVCRRCRTALLVDTAAMARLLGPDALFWGRHPRCRVWSWGDRERCEGRVTFEARSVPGGSWRALRMSGEVADLWGRR